MDERDARRARSFGQVAEQYERRRPDYPAELYDVVAAPRILESGAGTGRATAALLTRGVSVVAVEPDPQMAAVLRARLDVEVLPVALEEAVVEPGSFDVVAAAQSWHWVDPGRAGPVAARALRPGGRLCAWWNRAGDMTGPVWEAVHAVHADLAPEVAPPDAETVMAPAGGREIPAVPGFTPWRYRDWAWTQEYSAEEFVELMGTHSHYLEMEPDRRTRLFDGIRSVIPESIVYPYLTILLEAVVT